MQRQCAICESSNGTIHITLTISFFLCICFCINTRTLVNPAHRRLNVECGRGKLANVLVRWKHFTRFVHTAGAQAKLARIIAVPFSHHKRIRRNKLDSFVQQHQARHCHWLLTISKQNSHSVKCLDFLSRYDLCICEMQIYICLYPLLTIIYYIGNNQYE